MLTSYLHVPAHEPARAKFPVFDAHNHLWGAWSLAAAIVPVMDEVGVCAYCDLLAQLALRPELPAPAQKSSPKKKSSANSPDL
jgi:hypothetical protein